MAVQKTNTIKSSGPALLQGNSPSRVTSPPSIRTGKPDPIALAKDIESLSGQLNQIHNTLARVAPSIEHFLLQNNAGELVGILGSESVEGQWVTNWLKELRVGGTPLDSSFVADETGAVSLTNATITLTSTAGTITLDPTGPKITIVDASGDNRIEMEPTGPKITVTSLVGTIVIDASGPKIVIKDHLGATVAQLGVDAMGNGELILNGPTLNNPSISGSFFSGTATVRNSSGLGTSTFHFNANGQCTSYTP